MEGLAKANLPSDIVLEILKEYLRLWSTRIPRDYKDKLCGTNRAALVNFYDGHNVDAWWAFPTRWHNECGKPSFSETSTYLVKVA